MRNLLDQARGKSEKDRKIIALAVAGVIVAIIFTIWASSLISRLSSGPEETAVLEEEVAEVQTASVFDSIKRKAGLLFGEGSPLQKIDIFSETIEYKKEDNIIIEEEGERDLQAILEDFNATNTEATETEMEEAESEL